MLVDSCGQRLGVVGDEVLLDPAGLILRDAQLQHRLIDRVEERFRGSGSRRRRRWTACAGDGSQNAQGCRGGQDR